MELTKISSTKIYKDVYAIYLYIKDGRCSSTGYRIDRVEFNTLEDLKAYAGTKHFKKAFKYFCEYEEFGTFEGSPVQRSRMLKIDL